MRNKVLAAIEQYAEGGTIRDAVAAQKISNLQFYRAMEADHELASMYGTVQRFRADMMADEAYAISMDDSLAPQVARERAAIRLKIAGLLDRAKYGEKVIHQHDAGPNILAAMMAEGDARLQPLCDLSNATDAEYVDTTALPAIGAPDKTSGAPPETAQLASVDPFGD